MRLEQRGARHKKCLRVAEVLQDEAAAVAEAANETEAALAA
jgi:hypothetical protein